MVYEASGSRAGLDVAATLIDPRQTMNRLRLPTSRIRDFMIDPFGTDWLRLDYGLRRNCSRCRFRGVSGKRLTTDGPFAETREQLTGFYQVDANDLDEPLAIAARIPTARFGSIEVRPIMKFS